MTFDINTKMTERQAYNAMFFFLDSWYEKTKSDELGVILGNLSRLPDGMPADSAIMNDWLKAVQLALDGTEPGPLSLS